MKTKKRIAKQSAIDMTIEKGNFYKTRQDLKKLKLVRRTENIQIIKWCIPLILAVGIIIAHPYIMDLICDIK